MLIHTAGVTFPSTLLAAHTNSVRRKKVQVLETLWNYRGNDPNPPPELSTRYQAQKRWMYVGEGSGDVGESVPRGLLQFNHYMSGA